MIPSKTIVIFLCTFLVSSLCRHCCAAGDNITTTSVASITDNGLDMLVSAGNKFQMGFFPVKTNWKDNRRYVGIWYSMDPSTIIWVANRENPLSDTTGILKVTEDGNLKVLDKINKSYFSTKLDTSSSFRTLKLLDTGNAVLIDDQSRKTLWQSFDNPTDTFLPGMKMDEKLNLTSWKSQDDPATGDFTFLQDPSQSDDSYIIWKQSESGGYYWKSGGDSANSFNPAQMFGTAASLLSNFSKDATVSTNSSWSRLLMNISGEIQFLSWDENMKKWSLNWSEPRDNCSIYNACGVYGRCDNHSMCNCLQGFKPMAPENWTFGDFTKGCNRAVDHICSIHDEFLKLTMMKIDKVGSQSFQLGSEQECAKKCLALCPSQAEMESASQELGFLDHRTCSAYSYHPGASKGGPPDGRQGCWIWDSEISDLHENGVHNISVRVSNSTWFGNINQSGGPRKKPTSSQKLVVIVTMITLVVLLLCSISYISYKRIVARRRESTERFQRDLVLQLNDRGRQGKDLLDLDHSRNDDTEGINVPFFELGSILNATNNFSDANKLGEGGFGPVYKGKLPGGLEIAVKRLSSLSGQGLEEFKNEVVLIAKLQHRNLVRLLGYCVKGDEKILLYEYMPNKSLDAFIFDRTLRMSLDWIKRFDIILGIARGLLYLHQDSRLRIIHRDLKTSNILLDEDMNPKISDFGLAKIVKGKEMEASTNRVIGTYGYMSPEYALDGLFSVKSDVFSFGVVVLEIVSGQKSTGFYHSQQTLSLLGYAWTLWKEDNPLDLMDKTLLESCNSSEVLKCIIVGLLCVQEDPGDRPTMTNVVLMLGSDISSLPNPKKPAFVAKRFHSSSSSSTKPETQSNNMLTISEEEGR